MKVGDNVVCVKTTYDRSPGAVKGRIYPILSREICKCGDISFDIGLTTPYIMACDVCGLEIDDGIFWHDPANFRPISYNSAHDELLNKEIVDDKADIEITETEKVKS